MKAGSIFTAAPVASANKINTITEALALPHFNAMMEANSKTSSASNCKDSALADAWQKLVLHEAIYCGNNRKKIDVAFFENAFGWNERPVQAREVWNRYVTHSDQGIFFEESATATGVNTDFQATLLRANHGADGKTSYPTKGWSLVDVDNNAWYSIEDKIVTTDYAHQIVLRPYSNTVVGSVKKNKKYVIVPARLVGGYSCPMPQNVLGASAYMQKIMPFRLRRDWHVKVDILRGYSNLLRWTVMWDTQGNKYDAWDTFQAAEARLNLQLARNMLAFLATPITNTALIEGTGATVVDSTHTGFYGYLPSIKYAGGNIVDFDPAVGLQLDADLEPFMLTQDALMDSTTYNVRHGKQFMARLADRTQKMFRMTNVPAEVFPAYQKNGGNIVKGGEITGYEYLGFKLLFEEFGVLSESHFLATEWTKNMAIMTPVDGVTDENGGAVPSLEFFQYGLNGETGDYWEEIVDFRKVTLCEEIKGSVAQSVMMQVHCPGRHILLNPVKGC